jgi:hypothetical protein
MPAPATHDSHSDRVTVTIVLALATLSNATNRNDSICVALPKVAKASIVVTVTCIDIESLQNRLLKVCYVPATSTGLPRVSFFFSFLFLLLWLLTVQANKAGSTCH